jgi:hypothetical protein
VEYACDTDAITKHKNDVTHQEYMAKDQRIHNAIIHMLEKNAQNVYNKRGMASDAAEAAKSAGVCINTIIRRAPKMGLVWKRDGYGWRRSGDAQDI